MAKTLLVVHHTPSPTTRALLDADGYLFGTTANFGYMSGALKHYLGGSPAIRDRANRAES
jgi:hypothetical protein